MGQELERQNALVLQRETLRSQLRNTEDVAKAREAQLIQKNSELFLALKAKGQQEESYKEKQKQAQAQYGELQAFHMAQVKEFSRELGRMQQEVESHKAAAGQTRVLLEKAQDDFTGRAREEERRIKEFNGLAQEMAELQKENHLLKQSLRKTENACVERESDLVEFKEKAESLAHTVAVSKAQIIDREKEVLNLHGAIEEVEKKRMVRGPGGFAVFFVFVVGSLSLSALNEFS